MIILRFYLLIGNFYAIRKVFILLGKKPNIKNKVHLVTLATTYFCSIFGCNQRTLTVGGSITVQLVSSLTSVKLTNEGNIILFVCSEAVKCNLVKLETSHTVMLPPTAATNVTSF